MSVGPEYGPVQRRGTPRDLSELFRRVEDLERVRAGKGAWAAINASHSGGYTATPLPFTAFATSDRAVFGTTTVATPHTPNNQTGDAYLQLLATGVYFISAAAQISGVGGTARSIHIDNGASPFSQTPPYGQSDLHGTVPNNEGTELFDIFAGTQWYQDTAIFIVDAPSVAQAVWVTAGGGDNDSINMYLGAIFVPTVSGGQLY